ncbi:hypothetical protein JAAARDRAFT_333277 [Jaapia argillacea MUCL 33604]|uniref:Cytochrome P450 n=1 Tax=Jaapia argillacea MUCL 33604 TaxID=933084 RepID=A0A067PK75_9AGAM|nr:hypothetical protein JAAARDRAFT_333277 [Jaapia argillacea MUCL 33604]
MIAGRNTLNCSDINLRNLSLSHASSCPHQAPFRDSGLRRARRRPTFDDIREMRYLRAVLNETLRLFPVVPFNIRESVNATTFPSPDPSLKPIYIPATTSILDASQNRFIGRRRYDPSIPSLKQNFQNRILSPAEEFDPECFIGTRVKKYLTPTPFIFLPCNAGPRIRLGQQFEYNEMSCFLIRLFQAFSSIALSPSSHFPGTLPPPEWSSAKGRMSIERIWPKSHLTMYLFTWGVMGEYGGSEGRLRRMGCERGHWDLVQYIYHYLHEIRVHGMIVRV